MSNTNNKARSRRNNQGKQNKPEAPKYPIVLSENKHHTESVTNRFFGLIKDYTNTSTKESRISATKCEFVEEKLITRSLFNIINYTIHISIFTNQYDYNEVAK